MTGRAELGTWVEDFSWVRGRFCLLSATGKILAVKYHLLQGKSGLVSCRDMFRKQWEKMGDTALAADLFADDRGSLALLQLCEPPLFLFYPPLSSPPTFFLPTAGSPSFLMNSVFGVHVLSLKSYLAFQMFASLPHKL